MSQSSAHSRVCPTRVDGSAALFTHRVTIGQCQDRQQGRYHKCYTCAYNKDYVAQNGEPKVRTTPAPPPALPRPMPVDEPSVAPERITAIRA